MADDTLPPIYYVPQFTAEDDIRIADAIRQQTDTRSAKEIKDHQKMKRKEGKRRHRGNQRMRRAEERQRWLEERRNRDATTSLIFVAAAVE